MKALANLTLITFGLLFSTSSLAQTEVDDAAEELKLAAVEALIMAPADKALPLLTKILAGDHSDEVKESALFILSQLDVPEAQETLIRFARDANGELQLEAIRMVGIGGDSENLAALKSVYETGDEDAREAVLEALMIAGDEQAVFEIALSAEGDDFENAVEMLAVEGRYALLLGSPDERAPRYELARVRDVVLAVNSEPIHSGSLESNPDFSVTARLRGRELQARLLLWAVLIAAVAVLGGLTFRLARRSA